MGDTEINSARRLLLELLDFLRYGNNLELHPTFSTFIKPISMKNIIQITLAIVVFLLLIFVVKNTFFKEKNCLDDYPEIIKKYHLEGKYDTARWVLYALNHEKERLHLVGWDSMQLRRMFEEGKDQTAIPPSFDEHGNASIKGGGQLLKYSECYLEPFDLDSARTFHDNETISFTFFPKHEEYFWVRHLGFLSYEVRFDINSDTIRGIGGGDYVVIGFPQNYICEKEDEFASYLDKNHDIAHCWLKQYYEKHKKDALNSPQNSLSSLSDLN